MALPVEDLLLIANRVVDSDHMATTQISRAERERSARAREEAIEDLRVFVRAWATP